VYNSNRNSQDDQVLVSRVLGGDTKAFSEIISNTERLVAQIIFKMIPNSSDRKDISQDVYLKAFHNLKNFRNQSKVSTWIAQITYNTCLNFLERKKLVMLQNTQNEDYPLEDELDLLSSRNGSTANDTEKILYQKEIAEILKREIDSLTPVYKTLITLYHNEELSYAEIAQITELPEGTVKNYLFRARKELRDNILLNYNKEAL
jgi:RNA polymerase sigma factor (sigma-70 family)